MESMAYLQVMLALLLVLGLILCAGWLAQRYGFGAMSARVGGKRRLNVIEAAAVDSKRRLVLVRRDNVEHLILIGGGQDILLEAGIPAIRFTLPEQTPTKPEESGEKSA
jgi:flagellar protein FliO/FliZ